MYSEDINSVVRREIVGLKLKRQKSQAELALSEYDSKLAAFGAMETSCRRLIGELLRAEGLRVLSVDGRVKERSSLSEKLVRPGKSYSCLADVTDLVGLRVVTFFEDDVDKVAKVVAREFELIEEHCVDKRNELAPDRFGYKSLHYVCRLPHHRKTLIENQTFKDVNFEIQIRSVLQHAWAEVEHDLGYKGKIAVPNEIRREFFRVASLLEFADKSFREVRDKTLEYQQRVAGEILRNEVTDLELDVISYEQFVGNSREVRQIDAFLEDELGLTLFDSKYSPESNTKILRTAGINTVAKLKQALTPNLQILQEYARIAFIEEVAAEDDGIETPKAVSLFHLAQLIAFDSGGIAGLVKLHRENRVGRDHPYGVEESSERVAQQLLLAKSRAAK